MNNNKYICYKIVNDDRSRNNDQIIDVPEIHSIQSCEIVSGRLYNINNARAITIPKKYFNSQINILSKENNILNIVSKDEHNQININDNFYPNSNKIYKAMSNQNILSNSFPKQLGNKIKIILPNKLNLNILSSQNNIIKQDNFPNNGFFNNLIYKRESNILQELKKLRKIQSSFGCSIGKNSEKNKIIISNKPIINKFYIDAYGDHLENKINNLKENNNNNDNNRERNLYNKDFINQRYFSQIKKDNFKSNYNIEDNSNYIQNNKKEIAYNSNSDQTFKTCENEKRNIGIKIKNCKMKHSISTTTGNKINKILKMNAKDNEIKDDNKKKFDMFLNKVKRMKFKNKKIKKRKKRKNKSAKNPIIKVKSQINDGNIKRIKNIKFNINLKIKEKEKTIETKPNNRMLNFLIKNHKEKEPIFIAEPKIKIININKVISDKNNNEIKKNESDLNKKEISLNIKTIRNTNLNHKIFSLKDKIFNVIQNDANKTIKNIVENKENQQNQNNNRNVDMKESHKIENEAKNNENKVFGNEDKTKENENLNNKTIEIKPKTYIEKYKKQNYYMRREQSSERIARTRKEYMLKGSSQSLQNLNNHFYLILPGNASYLIKNCMCHRTNWKEPFSNVTSIINFKWQQLSYGIEYNSLGHFGKQVVNHFENHYAISNKANMFINIMHYCEMRKISVFKYLPFTIIYQIKDRRKISDEEKEKKWKKNIDNLKIFIEKTSDYATEYNELGKYFFDDSYLEEKNKRNDYYKKKSVKNKKNNNNNKEENEPIFDVDNKEEGFNGKYTVYNDIFPKLEIYDRIPEVNNNNNNKNTKNNNANNQEKKIGINTVIEIPKSHYTGKNMWVIKAINLNRGMCIKVVDTFKEMEKVIEKFKKGVDYHFTEQIINEMNEDLNNKTYTTNMDIKDKDKENNNNKEKSEENKNNSEINKKEKEKEKEKNNVENNIEKENDEKDKNESIYYCDKIIIQKYIENPLLYRERKCDMRIWVLLTHQMKVYLFKEGHLKTCSIQYDPNSKDAFSHITNYSFQKYNDNFQKFEKGNEVPFFEFQKFIDEKYPEKKYNIYTDLIDKLKEIINISMRSVKDKINKNGRNYQFEIFGYDFMLDNDFNVYLIEINTNPGLEESSPWIKVIVPRMLDDALRLTVDQIFEPKYDFNLNYKDEEEINNLKIVENNLKNKIDPNSIININDKLMNENNKNKIAEEKNKISENKNIEDKNKKYISPFPVPGYDLDDNLWEFVCDLNGKDPLDNQLEKEETTEKESYTGIRHLLKKKNTKLNLEKSNKKEISTRENKNKDNHDEKQKEKNDKDTNKDNNEKNNNEKE